MGKGSLIPPNPMSGAGPLTIGNLIHSAGVIPPPFSGAGNLGRSHLGMAPQMAAPMAPPVMSAPASGVRDAMLRNGFSRGSGSPDGRM